MISKRLENFLKLSYAERTQVFLKWVKSQSKNKEYTYSSVKNCPLGQFARFIKQNKDYNGTGGANSIYIFERNSHKEEVQIELWEDDRLNSALINNSTFGQLAKSFRFAP